MNPVLSAEVDPKAQVNPVQGCKVLAGPEDLDFTIEGPLPLRWQRSYRSSSLREGWFGRGWRSPLEGGLEPVFDPSGGFVEGWRHVDAFGRAIDFPLLAPGAEHFNVAEQLRLSRTSTGQYRLAGRDGETAWLEPDATSTRLRLVAVSDRNDNTTRVAWRERDGTVDAARVSCSGGQELLLRFAGPRLVEVVDLREDVAAAQVVLARYGYDAHGNLAAVWNRAGDCVRRFGYGTGGTNGPMTHEVHADTFEQWFEYAGAGASARVVRHGNNVGGRWALRHFDDRTEITDQQDRVTVFHSDTQGRWIGLTDALGRFTRRALDRLGRLRATVDPALRATETVFDERSNPVETRDADGATTRIEWHDSLPLIVAVTDPLGRTARWRYDARGNVVAETDPGGATTRYVRDARGLAVQIVDAHGGVKRLAYDRMGLLQRYTDCSGKSTVFERDADGRVLAVVDALGQRTSFAYDDAGRLSRHVLADGSRESYRHDAAGRLLSVTDGLGRTTRFEYAPDSVLTRRIDALGNELAYRYDRARRLQEVVDELGARCAFEYDVLDRVVAETRFDGWRTQREYDDSDDLVGKVEAPDSGGQAIVSRFERDAAGRLLSLTTGHHRLRYVYDAAGQLVRAGDGVVDLRMRYDACGRVIGEETQAGQRVFKVKHEFDLLGNRLKSTLPDGMTLAALYYGSGHCHQLRLGEQAITDFERDDLHREVARTQGALDTTRSYDPAGRLASQVASVRGSPGPAGLIARSYAYDRAGRLAAQVDRGRRLVVEHDAIGQLTRFDDERFAFDPAHNRLATGRGSESVPARIEKGRVTVQGDRRFTYDAHGRLIDKRIGAHTRLTFAWDELHQLTASTREWNGTTVTTRYLYDALGRRIGKKSDAGTTWFVWIEDQLAQQLDETRSDTFVYEPDSFVPLALHSRANDDAPLLDGLRYYHCDQIGQPRELTSVDGTIAWEARCGAWGKPEEVRSRDDVRQPLRFEGQYEDAETGLHYSRFRYYDPDMGAFVTADPLGLDGGENFYAYAPSPLDWTDPYGLFNKRRKNGQFAAKPGPKKKTDSSHGCSLDTTKPAQGYELRDLDTDEVQKYGETTVGKARYSQAFLEAENVRLVFVTNKMSKRKVKAWENKKILAYKAQNGGCRPRLNKSDH